MLWRLIVNWRYMLSNAAVLTLMARALIEFDSHPRGALLAAAAALYGAECIGQKFKMAYVEHR